MQRRQAAGPPGAPARPVRPARCARVWLGGLLGLLMAASQLFRRSDGLWSLR